MKRPTLIQQQMARIAAKVAKPGAPAKPAKPASTAKVVALDGGRRPLIVSRELVAAAKRMRPKVMFDRAPEHINPFKIPAFPKFAGADGKEVALAMDSNAVDLTSWAGTNWSAAWAAQTAYSSAFFEGVTFLGYTYLAELAQRPEYRKISERIATDMTRKWIRLMVAGEEVTDDEEKQADQDKKRDKGKAKRIKVINDELSRLHARDRFREIAEIDGFFGRAHLYFDFGDLQPEELMTSIGDGRSAATATKVSPARPLLELRTVEPIWCYPMQYNSNNPLAPDWYRPQLWNVMGRMIHRSRIRPFVGREVPDMLKPSYAFGGLALSQMAKPYVDNWLRARQSVSDLLHAFSTSGVKTDLSQSLTPGGSMDNLNNRLDLYTLLKDNRGIFALDKNEEFFQFNTPLGTVDALQAQAQEQMASVVNMPVVILMGITPTGLNACLPGDTLILTDRGQVPIRDVTLSDRVMTRRGLAPLTFSGITKYATELIEIKTESATLKCTANHPIWLSSTNEFVRAENVRLGDCLLLTGEKNATPKMRRPWHGAGNGGGKAHTDTIPHGTLALSARFFSIGKYGKHIAGLFRRIFTSITSTATERTINSIILSRCMGFCMPSFTALSTIFADDLSVLNRYAARNAGRSLLSRSFQVERNFAAAPARSPIDEQTAFLGQKVPRSAFALCVDRLSAHLARVLSFARGNVQPPAKTAAPTTAPIISLTRKNTETSNALRFAEPVVSVKRIAASEPVYDLSVGLGHLPEFFANRVLTHNSSEGEIRVYYDWIEAFQEKLFRDPLTTLISFIQLSKFGDVDTDILFSFEPLWSMTKKEEAEVDKLSAEADQIRIDSGVLDPVEVRQRIAADPNSPYPDIDPEDAPEPPEDPLAPKGEGDDNKDAGGGSEADSPFGASK